MYSRLQQRCRHFGRWHDSYNTDDGGMGTTEKSRSACQLRLSERRSRSSEVWLCQGVTGGKRAGFRMFLLVSKGYYPSDDADKDGAIAPFVCYPRQLKYLPTLVDVARRLIYESFDKRLGLMENLKVADTSRLAKPESPFVSSLDRRFQRHSALMDFALLFIRDHWQQFSQRYISKIQSEVKSHQEGAAGAY